MTLIFYINSLDYWTTKTLFGLKAYILLKYFFNSEYGRPDYSCKNWIAFNLFFYSYFFLFMKKHMNKANCFITYWFDTFF